MKKLFLPAVMLISLSLMSFAYLPDDEDEREKVRAAVLVSGQVSEDIKSNIGSAEIYPVSILNAEKFLSLEKLEDAVSEERQWHIIYGSTDVTVSRETGWRVTGFAELSESLPTAESCAAEGLDICVVYVPEYGARLVLSEEGGSLRAAQLQGRPDFTGLIDGKVYPFEEAAAILKDMLPEGMGGFNDTSLPAVDENVFADDAKESKDYSWLYIPLGCAAAALIAAVLIKVLKKEK